VEFLLGWGAVDFIGGEKNGNGGRAALTIDSWEQKHCVERRNDGARRLPDRSDWQRAEEGAAPRGGETK